MHGAIHDGTERDGPREILHCHTLKPIMIDLEIVIEQVVVNPDNNHYNYFANK